MSSGIRSYFCVYNNPEWINVYDSEGVIIEQIPSEFNGLEPQEICDLALELWIKSRPKRYGWVGYCISAQGLHHLHMVLESDNTIEFSSIKKVFPRAHLEVTHGKKKQVEDYINKRGIYEEKGEEVVCFAYEGDLKGNQGSRSDLKEIQKLIDMGMKPSQIVGSDLKRQRYYNMIKSAYLKKREMGVPLKREVRVYWHYGESGTGKSHTLLKIADKFGRDEVYKIVRDLSKGRFDQYEGEKCLFLDEVKPRAMDWVDLLTALDSYVYRPSARYQDSVALWEEVHVTSVYHPRKFWEECVPADMKKDEPYEQLERRIDVMVRHYKDKQGEFRREYSGNLNDDDIKDSYSECDLSFDSVG